MESFFCNLSEEEFSKGRKVLLWCFSGLFFFSGVYVLFSGLILGHKAMSPVLAIAPLGISLAVAIIAIFATYKGTDLFFKLDDEKIEYRFGMFRPRTHTFDWESIKEIVIPQKQKKIKFTFKDKTSLVMNMTWMEGHKSSLITKQLFHSARLKEIEVRRVKFL